MVLTFKDLQDRVMRVLDESATTSPTTLALVKDFLNQAHQKRCVEFPWNFMIWPKEVTFSTSVGKQIYALHEEFYRPLYIRNLTTGEYLMEVPSRGIEEQGGDWTADLGGSSTAKRFMYWGMQPVTQQPTTTSTIIAVSTSTSDTGSKTITIEGELSSGLMTTETLSMNGTTNVSGSTSFQEIVSVTKNTTFNGTATLILNATSTTVLSLAPAVMGKQYKTIFIPDEIVTVESIGYRFYRQPKIMVNDYDIPLIPAPHAQILVYDTLILMSAYLTDAGPQTLKIWQERSAQEQLALYQAYATEGQTVGGHSNYIRYTGEDDIYFPTVR